MDYSVEDCINMFHEKYPHYSKEDIKSMIDNHWDFIKATMSKNISHNIRVKYLGLFEVKKGRVKHFKKQLEKWEKEGKLTNPEYFKMIEEYEKKNK